MFPQKKQGKHPVQCIRYLSVPFAGAALLGLLARTICFASSRRLFRDSFIGGFAAG